jgi:hypothetical protein
MCAVISVELPKSIFMEIISQIPQLLHEGRQEGRAKIFVASAPKGKMNTHTRRSRESVSFGLKYEYNF